MYGFSPYQPQNDTSLRCKHNFAKVQFHIIFQIHNQVAIRNLPFGVNQAITIYNLEMIFR